jgi:hypothetical protein
MIILVCSYIIDSMSSFSSLLSVFTECFIKTFNNSASFFNLIVDVAETSGCTYILAYFLIDQLNLMSTLHDNTVLFDSKVNLTTFNSQNFLTKYTYLNLNKWLNSTS